MYGAANAGIALGENAPCVDGEVCDLAVPTEMPAPLTNVDVITAGDEFSCVRAGSMIDCWGTDYRGYIGPFQTNPIRTIVAPASATWTGISGGKTVTCGTTAANELACWGYVPLNMQTSAPMTLGSGLPTVRSVAFGENFGCVVTTSDQRICWGMNNRGQLGMGSIGTGIPYASRGTADNVLDVAADDNHACAAMTNGTVQCWGANDWRQSGALDKTLDIASPVTVKRAGGSDLGNCTQVSVGATFSCALCGGRVFCWGTNEQAELGRDMLFSYPESDIADEVKLPASETFLEMSAGHHHACALSATGKLYCWGSSLNGQVGDGTQSRNLPTPIGG
jgi:alpha-tubulin suppressor-like RCC1 family protein